MQQNHIRYFIIDAFTRRRFKGNPAAVVLTDRPLNDQLMQAVAGEMNLSETAFAVKDPNKEDVIYNLRWFTPTVEVDLCGHATLATAFVLFEEGYVPHATRISFRTKSGDLEVTKRQDHICMKFPSQPLAPLERLPEALSDLTGAAEFVGRNEWLTVVQLKSEEEVVRFKPDLAAIATLGTCLSITAPSATEARDFVSRMFGPNVGITEDPVTGAAHCALGPYWCQKLGKAQVRGEQVSHRPGVVHVEWQNGEEYLTLAGQAVAVAKGLLIDALKPLRD